MAFHQKLFFLSLTLLPTQLGFHFWPQWSIVLGRRVDYLSPTIFLTDILIVCMLASWIFQTRIKFSVSKLIPFFLFAFANIFFAASKPVAIYKWIKVLEFVGLGWYIIKTKPKINAIINPLSIGVLYSSLIAIAQFFLQHSIGLWILGERTFAADTPGIARFSWGREFLRPYATFSHPNVLGGFLAASLLFIFFKLRSSTFKNITLILGIAALFLSFSRSAWIAALVGFGIMKRKFLIPLLIIILILFFKFNVQEESVVIRQQLNTSAISMWKTSPIFGVGLGNFLVELPKFLVSREVYFLQPVHNIYLLILAETGIVGLGAWMWIISVFIKKKKLFIIRYSLFLILLLGFVDHYPITLQQGQLLLTILLVLQ